MALGSSQEEKQLEPVEVVETTWPGDARSYWDDAGWRRQLLLIELGAEGG